MTAKCLEMWSELFGLNFHQDWVEEFGTDAAAVNAIVASEPEAILAAASLEIGSLLSSDLNDEDWQ